jgi:hypothetical protein
MRPLSHGASQISGLSSNDGKAAPYSVFGKYQTSITGALGIVARPTSAVGREIVPPNASGVPSIIPKLSLCPLIHSVTV